MTTTDSDHSRKKLGKHATPEKKAIYWREQHLGDVPGHGRWLSAREQEVLQSLTHVKRRHDWRLGRWTAKQLVRAYLGAENAAPAVEEIDIRADDAGAPEVFVHDEPAGMTISISHSGGVAFCVLAGGICALGCDVEGIEQRSPAFINDYFTPSEAAIIDRAQEGEHPLLATLIWSAKESAMKALHTGLRVPPDRIEVMLSGLSDALPWTPLTVACPSMSRRLSGGWRRRDGFVQTVVSDASSDIQIVP